MAKVTSKLQVTVPKVIAEQYGIRPGDEIEWVPAGEAIRVVPPARRPPVADLEFRLRLFDGATVRQRKRQAGRGSAPGKRRRWTREDLYRRARPRRHDRPGLPLRLLISRQARERPGTSSQRARRGSGTHPASGRGRIHRRGHEASRRRWAPARARRRAPRSQRDSRAVRDPLSDRAAAAHRHPGRCRISARLLVRSELDGGSVAASVALQRSARFAARYRAKPPIRG
jgi:bifunctional DNA-binding transcriptional regulator/antitoxin component of YhaV-PrlF toxin-antitoxin module